MIPEFLLRSGQDPLSAALAWTLEAGADAFLEDTPQDWLRMPELPARSTPVPSAPEPKETGGTAAARLETLALARSAETLDDLKRVICEFSGLAITKTATNTVFSDGLPGASVMIVGEAPGADEDRMGRPFVGVSGQLLDRMFACIGLSRTETDPEKALYISNILNWRPPGNRTPVPAEIETCLPFIERHIALAAPKLLILAGGVSAKALLGREESVSRLRNVWHAYRPRTEGVSSGEPIPTLVTFHPAYLLRSPAQKRAAWGDLLRISERIG